MNPSSGVNILISKMHENPLWHYIIFIEIQTIKIRKNFLISQVYTYAW